MKRKKKFVEKLGTFITWSLAIGIALMLILMLYGIISSIIHNGLF